MDVAVIDWKDSKFEKDHLYEDINAPQWIDFSHDDPPVDDEAWFCRPDCNHPKTVEDFFRQKTPNSLKLQRSVSVSEIHQLGDRYLSSPRDAALKKRGFPLNKDSKSSKYGQDSENQNPNLSTPPNHKAKSLKEMIKSSSEKKQLENGLPVKEEQPLRALKSTLSARNLLGGRDILNQVTEFCNEVKRLATRVKDNGEKEVAKKSLVKQETGVLQESKNERKPLLEKCEEMEEKSNSKEKLARKKLNCDPENKSPIALNMKSIRGERVLQIRTNPPSPQCFSANKKATPPKAFRLRPQPQPQPQERGIVEVSSKEVKKEENEAKGLDVFWFLKPCTLSGSS